MAANSTVVFDAELWASITREATRRRKKPQKLITEIVREYLEREADLAWWRAIQRGSLGQEMTDEQAVEFVRAYRREKKLARKSGTPVRRAKRKASA